MKTVLFVCSGNTCRSPMAEAWLRVLCKDEPGIVIRSAGLSAASGSPASVWARETVHAAGGDLMHHQSRPLTSGMIREADLVVAMTRGHRARILQAVPEAEKKTFLLNHWSSLAPDSDVQDPFGGGKTEYGECFASIREAVENLYLSLKQNNL